MVMPVVIVPGILGTRLVNNRGRSIWDPDQGVTWDNARGLRELLDLSNAALPNPQATLPVEAVLRARGVVNGGNLVWGMGYNNLVMTLSDPSLNRDCDDPIKLYCAGYDWRRSNLDSARRLKAVVERALRETGAEKVVLIAHSMGGLVSRLFCRFFRVSGNPASNVVERLILLGSPIHGASKAYRVMRQSAAPADGHVELFSDIALNATEDGQDEFFSGIGGRLLARLIRRVPSLYEILPTEAFCSAHPNWLRFDTRRAGFADASRPNRLYANSYTGVDGDPALLARRAVFDRRLGSYIPSQSVLLFSNGHDTEVNLRINRWGNLENAGAASRNRGDGTVPTYSGRGSGSRVAGLVRVNLPARDHGGLANHPSAIRVILRYLMPLCAEAA